MQVQNDPTEREHRAERWDGSSGVGDTADWLVLSWNESIGKGGGGEGGIMTAIFLVPTIMSHQFSLVIRRPVVDATHCDALPGRELRYGLPRSEGAAVRLAAYALWRP